LFGSSGKKKKKKRKKKKKKKKKATKEKPNKAGEGSRRFQEEDFGILQRAGRAGFREPIKKKKKKNPSRLPGLLWSALCAFVEIWTMI